ncbi:MAG: rane protein [Acidimicrobiales bacterium]|nr:rane protein [Acidimicrobiales bacterium]
MRWVGSVAVLGLVLAGCGSSKTKTTAPATTIAPTTTTQDPAQAKAEITTDWETFFNEHTTVDQAVLLMENGEKHRAFRQMSVDKGQTKGTTAKVEKIEFEDANTAVVTFTLFLNGAPVLPHATGRAVRVNGKWLVSEEYNCSLEALGNNNVPPADCKP